MNRKETSNTFSQGVVNDLDPMNVPNTVLTDSLNGTIITYDGNEMSLQNDMGNYGLKNGKLKEGYIPVGMQEYGDILYVVSYNPIENKAEVGSLPSPNYIASPTSKQADSEEITSILDGLTGESDYYYDDESDLDEFEDEGENIDDLEPPSIKYTDIIERSKLKVFGNYSDDFLLNPGDYYKIEEGSFIKSKYESIDYYLIDTDRKVHDDLQINNDGSSFISPSWEMPG